jgi:hypothetical protein
MQTDTFVPTEADHVIYGRLRRLFPTSPTKLASEFLSTSSDFLSFLQPASPLIRTLQLILPSCSLHEEL